MKNTTVTFKIAEDMNYPPRFGIQIHNPLFRKMSNEEIIKEAGLTEYAEMGYETFIYERSTATVYIINNGINKRIKKLQGE